MAELEAQPNPQIRVPNMCDRHQWLLVKQTDYDRNDPWKALIICTQIALFQAATADPRIQKQLDGDVSKIESLGCLACLKPDAFGEIVNAIGTSKDLKKIKELGEKWIKDNTK